LQKIEKILVPYFNADEINEIKKILSVTNEKWSVTAGSRRAHLTTNKQAIGDNHELWTPIRRSQSPIPKTPAVLAQTSRGR
jgi:hypothetical protein